MKWPESKHHSNQDLGQEDNRKSLISRRWFIVTASLGILGLMLPIFRRFRLNPEIGIALDRPKILSRICDRNTLGTLGQSYLQLRPEEESEPKLLGLLGSGSVLRNSKDLTLITTEMDKRTRLDFDEGRTFILKGWVLSETEARQCALLSLLNK